MAISELYTKHCEKLKDKFCYRELININKQQDSFNNPIIDFTRSDYLNLGRHAKITQAIQHFADVYGTSGSSSRLLLCNQQPYLNLEKKIAKTKGTQAALVFANGYQTNASVLSALLDKNVLGQEPLVFTDKLIHKSMHDGCRNVRQIRFRHLDMQHLNDLLEQYKNDPRPKFIVTESVFSMDGDVTDIQTIGKVAKSHGAFLYVDEAHATGALGKDGYGLANADSADLIMGTFSKGVGVSGGYVACSNAVKNYLVNTCPGFIYSTAPCPALIGAIDAAWDLLPELEGRRSHLKNIGNYARRKLNEIGLDTGPSTTQIIPVILKDNNMVLNKKAKLLDNNIHVSAVRPPTVPVGSARLRLSLCANHTYDNIDYLIETLRG